MPQTDLSELLYHVSAPAAIWCQLEAYHSQAHGSQCEGIIKNVGEKRKHSEYFPHCYTFSCHLVSTALRCFRLLVPFCRRSRKFWHGKGFCHALKFTEYVLNGSEYTKLTLYRIKWAWYWVACSNLFWVMNA